MSTFGGISFTNKGKLLQAKALTGVQLNFTRLAVGDGSLTGQVIADLSALVHEVKTLPITTLKNTNDGKATIGGILTNQALVTGFYWREIGLFATDPVLGEILYCYGNAATLAEYIPAGSGTDLLEKQINIVAIIGNATSISATIDSSLVYATVQDLALKVDITVMNSNIDNINTAIGTKADRVITDDTTTVEYEMGINNGKLYYRVVV